MLDRLKNIMLKGCFIMNFFKKLLIKNKKVNHNNKEIQNNKLFEDILFEEYSYCNKVKLLEL